MVKNRMSLDEMIAEEMKTMISILDSVEVSIYMNKIVYDSFILDAYDYEAIRIVNSCSAIVVGNDDYKLGGKFYKNYSEILYIINTMSVKKSILSACIEATMQLNDNYNNNHPDNPKDNYYFPPISYIKKFMEENGF